MSRNIDTVTICLWAASPALFLQTWILVSWRTVKTQFLEITMALMKNSFSICRRWTLIWFLQTHMFFTIRASEEEVALYDKRIHKAILAEDRVNEEAVWLRDGGEIWEGLVAWKHQHDGGVGINDGGVGIKAFRGGIGEEVASMSLIIVVALGGKEWWLVIIGMMHATVFFSWFVRVLALCYHLINLNFKNCWAWIGLYLK